MAQRDAVFDICKFLIMLGVIAGHIAAYNLVDTVTVFQPYLRNVVVGVSMPAFFLMSGYFARRKLDGCDILGIISRISTFVWPLVSFGMVFAVVSVLLGDMRPGRAVLYPLVRLVGEGWFLRTLAIVYFMHAIVFWKVRGTLSRVFLLGIVYIVLLFLPHKRIFYWAGSVVHMFPYFTFGILIERSLLWHKKHLASIACGIIFVLVVAFEGDVRINGMGFYWVKFSAVSCGGSITGLILHVGRTITGISGTIFLLWLIGRSVALLPWLSKVSVLGTTTLGVYVLHEYPLVKIGKMERLSVAAQWPMALVVFFACHLLIVAINRNKWFHRFFFGDEKLVKSLISRIDK